MERCYNTGTIKATVFDAGGISGVVTGEIKNSYNIGKIESEQYAGGITGVTGGNGTGKIIYCYNAGILNSKNIKGGIIGYSRITDISGITGCYYITTSATLGVGESTIEGIEQKTQSIISENMKKTDFLNILNTLGEVWKKDENNINNGYPLLNWQ